MVAMVCGSTSEEEDDSDLDEIQFSGRAPKAPVFQLLAAPGKDQQVAVVKDFFSAKDIAMVHMLARRGDVKEINDRSDDLVYKHNVWRIEHQLKEFAAQLYERLMQTAQALDAQLWHGIRKDETYFPEIEYIEYDVRKLGEPGTIEKHRDNESQVTAVVLLTPSSEFQGGVNCFEGGEDSDDDSDARLVKLEVGDAVFFYGDRCYHWITPVVAGRRIILQMEISRALPPCSCSLLPEGLSSWLPWTWK
eukprot:TRINITY_DN26514_c0_g1_i2.p1 TRINITY_DN26514_c0_g1~~TRINITY_DN26514_c0_g1_i2.p1  ORF type:complete len:259 (-),score=58.14 TRINITY_DN26514_c0_g1_i2:121-864(-)